MERQHRLTSGVEKSLSAGFTLLESLIVILIIGVLAAIAGPGWVKFANEQRLKDAQDRVYWAMREAQAKAKLEKITWGVSFREIEQNKQIVAQWAVHPASVEPAKAVWHNLQPNVRIDPETTFPETDGVYRALFNYQGCPVSEIEHSCGQTALTAQGRLTLYSTQAGKAKRCVIISTLLGAMRQAKEKPKPDDGKYCY